MKNIKFDVVIPTFKPGIDLKTLLNKLRSQTLQPEKIIIINTEEKYLQKSLYAGISNIEIHHIKQEEFDHGATRDLGANISTGEFVIFMTQDAMPLDYILFEELLRPFDDNEVGVVYGRQLADENCNIIERFTRKFNYPEYDIIKIKADLPKLGIKTYFSSDVCAAYRKDLYIKNGGFIKQTIFNEDSIYASKIINMNYKVVYASKAKVLHYHNYSSVQYLKRNFDLGVSHRQNPEIFLAIKSENEGMKLVKDTARFLNKNKKTYLIPSLIIKSGFKFIGYKLGKSYKRLPYGLIKKITMNKEYWKKIGDKL